MLQTRPRRAGLTSCRLPHIGTSYRLCPKTLLTFLLTFCTPALTAHGHPWPALGGKEPRGNTCLQRQRWGPLSPACSRHSAPCLCAIAVTWLWLNCKSAFLVCPPFEGTTTNTLEDRQPTPGSLPRESPRTEEPGGLQSIGSQRVGHYGATNTHTHKHTHCWHPGLPWGLRRKRIWLQCRRHGFAPWVRTIPWRRERQPTPVFLPEEPRGQRSLAGYSPWGC